MAEGCAQMPNLASRAARSAASRAAGAIFICDINGGQRLATAQYFTLHRVLRAGHEYNGSLAAIAIRRIIIAVQRHLAASGDGSKGRPAAGPVRSATLDTGEENLAAVVEAKAARIDRGGDAPFTLLLQRAFGSACASRGYRHRK